MDVNDMVCELMIELRYRAADCDDYKTAKALRAAADFVEIIMEAFESWKEKEDDKRVQ